MIAVIIATHGSFSKELLKSSEMIFGKQKNVATISFVAGEGTDDLIEKYNKLLNELDCSDGALIMVDIFGGSPFNAASMIALKNEKIELITGTNLPMLLEVFAAKDTVTIKELVEIAENAGKESVKKLLKSNEQNIKEDEL
ncbi:MAG: PTS mannose transporter subunit IID [Clostridiales bacterium]|nr:PTS mannose transporter subunit IID [Clostridiales bacterium]